MLMLCKVQKPLGGAYQRLPLRPQRLEVAPVPAVFA